MSLASATARVVTELLAGSASDWLVFFSAAWGLVSWWPHDNMHRVMMMGDYWGLIRLEYGFHLTLIIAGVLIASYLWKQWIPRT